MSSPLPWSRLLPITGPDDYRNPEQFFARTCFTRALREHMGMVLRRLAGRTENSAPVMTLVTQFGGGKTHTLTALYHLAKHGSELKNDPGVCSNSFPTRIERRAHGQSRGVRRQRLGPAARSRDAVDRCRTTTGRRCRRDGARPFRQGNPTWYGCHRAS